MYVTACHTGCTQLDAASPVAPNMVCLHVFACVVNIFLRLHVERTLRKVTSAAQRTLHVQVSTGHAFEIV